MLNSTAFTGRTNDVIILCWACGHNRIVYTNRSCESQAWDQCDSNDQTHIGCEKKETRSCISMIVQLAPHIFWSLALSLSRFLSFQFARAFLSFSTTHPSYDKGNKIEPNTCSHTSTLWCHFNMGFSIVSSSAIMYALLQFKASILYSELCHTHMIYAYCNNTELQVYIS